jgi:aryl-alcohol dehydrogenase-like predicted oxidoreductase
MKIALGTVQFGLAYGAFNTAGQVPPDEVARLLARAAAGGVRWLDTAHAYGRSETVLGEAGVAQRFRLVTKVPAMNEQASAEAVHRFVAESLQRLRAERVDGLLLHRAADLLGPQGPAVWSALTALRDEGRVGRIGVSGYGADEVLQVLDRCDIGLVQLPINVFDRRHQQAGVLARCRAQGVEVHARSAFLQGFALADPAALTPHLSAYAGVLQAFDRRCCDLGLSRLAAALHAVADLPEVDQVVVGVDRLAQLDEILAAAASPSPGPAAWDGLGCDALDLIEPGRWQ